MDVESAKLLAAAIALIPILGVGLGLGNIFSGYYDAISRNPSTDKTLFKNLFLGFALTEALAIFCLGVSLIILFVF